jgi:hypothetical protein
LQALHLKTEENIKWSTEDPSSTSDDGAGLGTSEKIRLWIEWIGWSRI